MKISLLGDLLRFYQNPVLGISFILILSAVLFFLAWKRKKLSRCILSVILAVILIATYPIVMMFTWEYHPDIKVEIPNSDKTLVIKERSYLFSAEAELYYHKYGFDIYLGEITCGDDGYRFFSKGDYTVKDVGSDEIRISCGKKYYSNDGEKQYVYNVAKADQTARVCLICSILAAIALIFVFIWLFRSRFVRRLPRRRT